MNTGKIGIVILAAGGSKRFGSPKQLLEFEGKSLIRHSAKAAIGQDGCKVVVVTGEKTHDLSHQTAGLAVEIAENPDWLTGISSSIRLGLETHLDKDPDLSAVIFMLCDQPFVNSGTISRLILAYRSTGMPIVAARYEDTLGVPALFDRAFFAELMELQGDVGAKPIIRRHAADVHGIDAPEAFFDIDHREDYERLISSK